MPKQLISFVCQECGYESPAYLGKCPECGNWNSFKEFKESRQSQVVSRKATLLQTQSQKPEPLSLVTQKPKQRIPTGFAEMDAVLGGGIVPGSATLIAGDPGIGKSTLLLQLCLNLANNVIPARPFEEGSPLVGTAGIQKDKIVNTEILNQVKDDKRNVPGSRVKPGMTDGKTVLYISAEESKEQVALRALRLLQKSEFRSQSSESKKPEVHPPLQQARMIMPENLLLLSLTDIDEITRLIEETKPDLAVIDSVQTVESQNTGGYAGSIAQVRYATTQCIRIAKQLGIPIFLVGHVTKEGMVAGPMVLSHMVDTVLFLEGEKLTSTRLLRSLKNRFGPVDEVGVFLMQGEGMVEVKNPEQIFLSQESKGIPGSVLVVIMEGSRPFLIEIQALAVYSKFPMPRRVASGVDQRRLELLLAVLQKHAKLPLDSYDVFVNVAGGIKVTDRAVDLGICLAVYSSLKNRGLDKTVSIAEVGLLGELRQVSGIDKRIREAKKLGFSTIITPQSGKTLLEVLQGLGYAPGTKQWQEKDERHFKIPREEE